MAKPTRRPGRPPRSLLVGVASLALAPACAGPGDEPRVGTRAEPPPDAGARRGPEQRSAAPREHAGRDDAAPGHGAGHGGDHGAGHFADPERFAPAWNAPDRDAWQKPDEIIAALRLQPGATVVDLGAGTGYLIPKLVKAVGPAGSVVAVEPEPAMLTCLGKAAAREGWKNLRLHASTANDPKLPLASADAIVALNVWHHVEGRGAFAKKLAAALKPGGVFVVVDFLPQETEGFGPPLAMRLSAEQVRAELVEGGLSASVVRETLPRHYIVVGVRSK